MTSIPVLDITVDYEDSKESIESILKVVKPDWNLKLVQMKDLSIGYINKNVGCFYGDEKEGGVFVRMINQSFNPNMVANYKKISLFLNKYKLSPMLIAEFENGICSELVIGESLSWETRLRLRDEEASKAVIRYLARFHRKTVYSAAREAGIKDLTDESKEMLEENLQRTKSLWERFTNNTEIPQRIKDQLPTLDEIMSERDYLHELTVRAMKEKALIHMDTNPSNIIIEPDGEVMIVDYDMTSIGHVATELAGFFHGFINIRDPVMTDYPDEQFRRRMIRYYLEERTRVEETATTITDEMVNDLYEQVAISRLTWLFRYIFAGPFLTTFSNGNNEDDQLFRASIKYYEEYKRRKEEHSSGH